MSRPQPFEISRLCELNEVLDRLRIDSLFVVADSLAFEQSGAATFFNSISDGCTLEMFTDFAANPDWEDGSRAAQAFADSSAKAIVAVGGGSAIDIAKLARCLTSDRNVSLQRIQNAVDWSPDVRPFIAIPTTSGSGSQATQFAVVYIDNQKHSIAHRDLIPDVAVIDATLTHSCPRKLTAASGLDALCQGIEALWSNRSSETSADDAEEAIRLAYQHLAAATEVGDAVSRAGMTRAAHLAGRAINISKTTAPHAVSYALTSQFGIPHGFAVATTIAEFLRYNSLVDHGSVNDIRGTGFVQNQVQRIANACGANSVETCAHQLESLILQLGGQIRLQDWTITQSQIVQVLRSVNVQRLANNPRLILDQQLLDLLA